MAVRDIVPWRWGGLQRSGSQERPFQTFRREIESLHRDMDRLFEELWSEGFGSTSLPELFGRGQIMPHLDITEDEKTFHVHVELPGLDEKDVDIALSDRVLTIRGEKKQEKETKEKDIYRRERSFGSFRRSIELPVAVDTDKIQASFRKGVLSIELPKTKEAQEKVKHIPVKAA